MKKVLFFIHDLCGGGAERVLVNLVNNMDYSQFDITVMTLFDTGVNKQYLNKEIHYKYVYKRMFRGNTHYMKLFSPKQLHKKFISEHYDVEIAYLEGSCARIISGCEDETTRLVSWIHIEQKTPERASTSFRSVSEAENCYNRFDRIICVAKTVKIDFLSLFHIIKPVEVLYNTNESEKIRLLANELTDDVAIDNNEVNLVGVGKLLKNKGFDRLLRIVKRLKTNGYSLKLWILGTGSEESNYKKYISDNDLTENVAMLGYQTNPYKYISKCDLFVCASYAEGFSTAATEALIVGTPVCTVEVSGMKEMLGEHNEYGVVTENNEEALYEEIKDLLDDSELLTHYRNKAIERGKMFSTEKTVKAVEDMLLSL